MKTGLEQLLKEQREYFAQGKTKELPLRLAVLKALKRTVQKYEKEIGQALQKDLGKSATETYMCETGMVLSELSHMIRHLHRYAKEQRVRTPLAQFHARSFTSPEPYGVVLVMAPWNYPFMLQIAFSHDPFYHIRSRGRHLCRCQAERVCACDCGCDRKDRGRMLFAAGSICRKGRQRRKYGSPCPEI